MSRRAGSGIEGDLTTALLLLIMEISNSIYIRNRTVRPGDIMRRRRMKHEWCFGTGGPELDQVSEGRDATILVTHDPI